MLVYVRCYESTSPIAIQEQVWRTLRNKGWMSAGPIQGINRFYIPEHLVTWCLLIDSNMRALPEHDWIV